MRVAEKTGQVGGQRVDKVHGFRLSLRTPEQCQVGGEAVQPTGPQTPDQTGVHQFTLAGIERNPRHRVQQFTHRLEISLCIEVLVMQLDQPVPPPVLPDAVIQPCGPV